MRAFLVLLPVILAIVFVQSRSVTPARNVLEARAPASECTNPPLDNCSFYADCLESRYHCGPQGYPIGYGQYYCEKFSEDRSWLDAKGQTWMINTMHCLQEDLVPYATGAVQGATCSSLKDKAFSTHAGCYIDNGLCTLSPKDWLAIIKIVNFETLFSSWDAFKATIEAGTGCLEFYAFLVEQGIF